MLQTLQIKHHYKPMAQFLDVEDPVWKAWRTMKDCDVKKLPVVKSGKIIGIVSDKDIVQISGYNGGQSMPVKEAMSLNPLIIYIDDSMDKVIRSMLLKDQEDAVVINRDGQIVGLFSWSCAFKFFLNFADMSYLRQLMSN